MRQLLRNFPPRIVSRKCVLQSSARSTFDIAAAMPPSAITVCAFPSRDLHTTPTLAPCANASIAARNPAPPAPMIKTSCSWVSYFSVTTVMVLRGHKLSDVENLLAGDRPHVFSSKRQQSNGLALGGHKLDFIRGGIRVTMNDSPHVTSLQPMLLNVMRQNDSVQ